MIKFLEVKRAYYANPENVVAQWRYVGDTNWMDVIGEPCWDADKEYRIRPRTIRIGDIDVPEPVRESLIDGDYYFIADCSAREPRSAVWRGISYDRFLLSSGLIHRDASSAEAHRKALILVSGGKV